MQKIGKLDHIPLIKNPTLSTHKKGTLPKYSRRAYAILSSCRCKARYGHCSLFAVACLFFRMKL